MLSGFSKILASTAASVGKSVQSTVQEVTGPKCLADYDMGEQIGSGGPGMLWKLYRGVPKSKVQQTVHAEVCIWFLDKKALADERAKRGTRKSPLKDKTNRPSRKAAEDQLLDIFRADAKVLQKLRHPGIVRVVEPLSETQWAMAMVTEPIFSSVANALGNVDNLVDIPPHLEKLDLGILEVKHALMQLSEALSFIHRNARLIHRGISPESVFITTNGGWKFAGFGFSTMAEEGPLDEEPAFLYPDFDVDYPVLPLQPPLDYTAPELTRPMPISARGGGLDARLSVDLFSLGLLTYHLVAKKALLRCANNLETYHLRVTQLRNLPLSEVPMDLEPELRRMLSMDPAARPTASDFASSRFFTEDMRLTALKFLDEMIGRGNDQRAEFLNSLPGIWSGFDSRVLRFKVLPPLLNELKNPATQLLALPWVLEVVEVQDPKDFQTRTQTLLIPAMEAAHGELLLLFLRHMPALATKASPEIMMSHLLPMLMRAFEDADPRLQEETLRRSIALVPKLDFTLVKEAVLPRVHLLALRTSVAAVRVQALVSLGELVPTLDKPCIMDILQTMSRCASVDHSPPTIMCIVGIANVITKEYGMEFSAQHILPLLAPLLVVQQLSNAQFARMLKLIMDVLTQIQDKRGVSLSEADSISLDLASMGLASMNGDAHAAPEKPRWMRAGDRSKPTSPPYRKINWSKLNNSDGWNDLPSAGPAAPSPAPAALADPFANAPPLQATLSSGPVSSTPLSATLSGGAPPSSNNAPSGSLSSGAGPMADIFAAPSTGAPPSSLSSSNASWPAPASSFTAAAPTPMPPTSSNDPFALSSGPGLAPLGASGAGALGGGLGAGSSGGLGGLGSVGSGGVGGMGSSSLVPDRPPPDDDPFADWPPRKPAAPAAPPSMKAPNLGGMGGTSSFESQDWAHMQSFGAPPPLGLSSSAGGGVGGIPMRSQQQAATFSLAPPPKATGPSLLGSSSSAGATDLFGGPPATNSFGAFPPPPSAGGLGGFNSSPQPLIPTGATSRPPSRQPFDLL